MKFCVLIIQMHKCLEIFLDDANAVLPNMNDISVEDLLAELSDYNLLNHEILKVLDTIREAMINEVRIAFVYIYCALLMISINFSFYYLIKICAKKVF